MWLLKGVLLYSLVLTPCLILGCKHQRAAGVADRAVIQDKQLTASSSPPATGRSLDAHHGRLNGSRAWCPRSKKERAWLQVDLGRTYNVCAVATQGRDWGPKQYTTNYTLSLSIDGVQWSPYKWSNRTKIFNGNTDSTSIKTNLLPAPAHSRFVRFHPQNYSVWPCLRVEIYVDAALPRITTNQKPAIALGFGDTLNLTCLASGDPPPQIRWLKDGRKNNTRASFSESHALLSISHVEPGDSGNYTCIASNAAGLARHTVTVTVFPCSSISEIGVANNSKVDHSQMKASSEFGKAVDYLTVKYGRLRGAKAWCPATKDGNDWLEVDLGAVYHVCGVATQGKEHRTDEWTTSFKLAFSVNNTNSRVYRENGREKVFKGNVDKSGVVINALPIMQRAQFVRFYPTASHLWPCLRVEIFVEIAPPRLLQGPRNQTVAQGGSVILSCKTSGSPAPTVRWLFNDNNVTKGNILKNGSLVISRVMNSGAYEGRYTCHASSQAGSARSSAYVRVVVLPRIFTPLKKYILLASGDSLRLVCIASGDPRPQIKWLKNGSTDIKRANITEYHYSELSISHVQQGDSGDYDCVARNTAGAVKTRSTVTVFGCSSISEIGVANSSKVDHSRMKASSEFGKAVDYLTVKYGRLRGAKAWCPATKDGNDWLEVDLGAVYRVCGVATQGKEHRTDEWTTKFKLAFSVSNTSSRVYRENGQEKDFKGNVDHSNVVVNALPITQRARFVRFYPTASHHWPCLRVEVFVEITSPTLVQRPRNQTVLQGGSVTLSCKVSGSPMPTVGWLFNNRNVTNGVVLSNGSLLISRVMNNGAYEGRYTCNAISNAGIARSSAYVRVLEKPQIIDRPPSHQTYYRGSTLLITCKSRGDPPPTVTWTWNNHVDIPNVQYRDKGSVLMIDALGPSQVGVYRCVVHNIVGEDSTNITVDVFDCNKTRSVGVSNSSVIPDSAITSSSVYGVSESTVKYGRLNAQRAWCPEKRNGRDWLQIDLGGYYFICGVATQGSKHGKNEWTSQYKVGLSRDGSKWQMYKEDEQEKLFAGNRDWGTVVRNPLRSQAFWRFVRFYPMDSHKWPCMRVDVFVEIAVPFLVVKPSSQAVEQGRDVRLDCQAAGVSLSFQNWRFRAKPVTSGVVMANGSLLLTSVKNTADYEGTYVCETGLGDNKTKASAEITIYEKPRLTNSFRSVETFVVGKTGVLVCHTVGDPTPDVTWLKDGVPIGSRPRYTYHENKAVLVVTAVKSHDGGTFTCVSQNQYGDVKTSSNVTVIDRPTISKDKTRSLVETMLGVPTNVVCFVNSGLPVTFNWIRNGKILTSTDSIQIYENVLVFVATRKEDFGVFTCVATNAAGTTAYNITLALAERGLGTSGEVEANQAQDSGSSERASIIAPFVLFIVALLALNFYLLYRLRRRRLSRQQSEIQLNLIGLQQDETSGEL